MSRKTVELSDGSVWRHNDDGGTSRWKIVLDGQMRGMWFDCPVSESGQLTAADHRKIADVLDGSSDASRLAEAVRDALTELIHDVDCGTLPRGATGHVIEAWRDTHYPTPEGKP